MNKSIIINETEYNAGNPLIIAELGTSHGGDAHKAKETAAAAADSGAGCVKLQLVFADEILHPNTGEVSLPGGKIRLYDRFKQLEQPIDFFAELKQYIESLGLLFLCTPFGPKSASLLHALQPKMVKIASPELNYTALLRHIAGWDIPVLLSTGVSMLGDIEEALQILGSSHSDICLLHCVTAYPAPETDYNLRALHSLSSVFGLAVGVSDHSLDAELVPALAVTQGAAVIEKHFCLSREGAGLDDPIALPPKEFSRMAQAVKKAAKAGPLETTSGFCRQHGKALIEQILGSGVKSLAPSERENYARTNRSLHALYDIKEGDVLKPEDFAALRTEKNLRPGLPPSWSERITGKTARRPIPAGEGICFEDLVN
ncbi:MAG: N-acetylneuraminate synthase family protein [Treponema sp.]|nr:N-acetylneuraminate synthase family protein [Treponema sp.]